MEVGRVCVWGGLGKCYLPFLSLINVKNNGALVVHQPHSTWFWFTSPAEETACSKLVPGRRTATSPHHCFHRFAILSSSAPRLQQTLSKQELRISHLQGDLCSKSNRSYSSNSSSNRSNYITFIVTKMSWISTLMRLLFFFSTDVTAPKWMHHLAPTVLWSPFVK